MTRPKIELCIISTWTFFLGKHQNILRLCHHIVPQAYDSLTNSKVKRPQTPHRHHLPNQLLWAGLSSKIAWPTLSLFIQKCWLWWITWGLSNQVGSCQQSICSLNLQHIINIVKATSSSLIYSRPDITNMQVAVDFNSQFSLPGCVILKLQVMLVSI